MTSSSPWILALTPLAYEWKILSTHLGPARNEKMGSLQVSFFDQLGLALAPGGHGKTQFALQTSFFLHRLPEIKGLICVGAAGSLVAELKSGDVFLAEETIEHDFHLKFVKKPLPRFAGYQPWIEKSRRLRPEGFQICRGVMASGDEDVIDQNRAQEIAKLTGAQAVAWEGAGGGRAARFYGLPYLEIRGITDAADSDSKTDFEKNLERTLQNCAWVLSELLSNGSDQA